ncbi:cytochrome c oxidase assembly factor Coa1 family protein, partial [Hyphobacterium sp. SN044]|uniref:cytochrome c oxidase assembly factor Coa1 family protein n=1 Tax=Hyphobacterium sp. SN044 TaxID=2912575 RepID=UPI0034E04DD8
MAAVGAFVALGGAGYFQWRIQANFRRQPFYVESIRLLQGYPPAVRLLGEPIRLKDLDLGDTKNTWTDGLNARLAIPVKGSLTKATLHS